MRHGCGAVEQPRGDRMRAVPVTLGLSRGMPRRPRVRSRHSRVRAAAKQFKGDGIRAFSVTLGPSHAIFRLPCRFPWRHGRRAAAKRSEGDVSEALFVTLAPSRAIFRLPRMISRHSSVRPLACLPHGAKSTRGAINLPADSL